MNKITVEYLREQMGITIPIAMYSGAPGKFKMINYKPLPAKYTVVKSGEETNYKDWEAAMDSYNDYDLSSGE